MSSRENVVIPTTEARPHYQSYFPQMEIKLLGNNHMCDA